MGTFETPASLLEGTSEVDEGGPGLAAELNLLAFDCEDGDEETAMHVGTLAEGEDARNIWRDHSIGDAVGCTFPHSGLAAQQREVRCPQGIAVEEGGESSSSSLDLDQEQEQEQAQQDVSSEESSSSSSPELDQEPELEQAQQDVLSAASVFEAGGVVLAVLLCSAAVMSAIFL